MLCREKQKLSGITSLLWTYRRCCNHSHVSCRPMNKLVNAHGCCDVVRCLLVSWQSSKIMIGPYFYIISNILQITANPAKIYFNSGRQGQVWAVQALMYDLSTYKILEASCWELTAFIFPYSWHFTWNIKWIGLTPSCRPHFTYQDRVYIYMFFHSTYKWTNYHSYYAHLHCETHCCNPCLRKGPKDAIQKPAQNPSWCSLGSFIACSFPAMWPARHVQLK